MWSEIGKNYDRSTFFSPDTISIKNRVHGAEVKWHQNSFFQSFKGAVIMVCLILFTPPRNTSRDLFGFGFDFYYIYILNGASRYVLHQDDLEGPTLASKMSRLDLNLGPAINCHPGVSHAR